MAKKATARVVGNEDAAEPQRDSEHPDFPKYGEPGFAPQQEPGFMAATLNGSALEQARAEQAEKDRAALADDPAAALPLLATERSEQQTQAPLSTEQATQQLIEATQPGPVLSPAEYEAKRFEAFKLDVYRVLYKHKYTLTPRNGELVGLFVLDAGNTSRMKRQLAQAGCVESLVNLTGKVEL